MWLFRAVKAIFRSFFKFPPDLNTLRSWDLLIWILFIFWFRLPFHQSTDESVVAALNAGKPVLRGYDFGTYKVQGWNGGERGMHMLMTFQVHEDDNGLKSLTFGGGNDILHKFIPNKNTFNLTNAYLPLAISEVPSMKNLPPPLSLTIPTSTPKWNSFIWNPSWFDQTDAAFNGWWFHHASRNISFLLHTDYRQKTVRLYLGNVSGGPMLTIRLDGESPEFTFPTRPSSYSPTTLYHTRLAVGLTIFTASIIELLLYFTWLSHSLIERRRKVSAKRTFIRYMLMLTIGLPLLVVARFLSIPMLLLVLAVRINCTVVLLLSYFVALTVGDQKNETLGKKMAKLWCGKKEEKVDGVETTQPAAVENGQASGDVDLEAGPKEVGVVDEKPEELFEEKSEEKSEELTPLIDLST